MALSRSRVTLPLDKLTKPVRYLKHYGNCTHLGVIQFMKEQILKLHKEGLSFKEIAELIPCNPSTVWYHCNPKAKDTRNKQKRLSRPQSKKDLKMLFGGACKLCGYNRCLAALDFHHLIPENKTDTVSHLLIKNKSLALEEAKKCILVCSNCHDEIHAGVRTV